MTQEQIDALRKEIETLGSQVDQRLLRLEERMETMGDDMNSIRQNTSELLEIAQLHQQGLRLTQRDNFETKGQIREMQAQILDIQAEIRQIWQYLTDQRHNGHGG
jgi:chromosome segregation ATPase